MGAQLELYPAEVTTLIDEQCGSKSTLVKILTSVYPPDSGQICLDAFP